MFLKGINAGMCMPPAVERRKCTCMKNGPAASVVDCNLAPCTTCDITQCTMHMHGPTQAATMGIDDLIDRAMKIGLGDVATYREPKSATGVDQIVIVHFPVVES